MDLRIAPVFLTIFVSSCIESTGKRETGSYEKFKAQRKLVTKARCCSMFDPVLLISFLIRIFHPKTQNIVRDNIKNKNAFQ